MPVLLAVIGAPGAFYLAGYFRAELVSDADHLMPAELIPSLLSGAGLDSWTIPQANYMIPDWPLYAVALGVGRTPTGTIAVFALLQTALLAAGVFTVVRAFDRSAPVWVSAVPVAIVAVPASTGAVPSVYLAASFTHIGTFILSLFALSSALRWLAGGSGRTVLVGGIVSAAAVFSDRIFVVWFLVPAAATIALLWIAGRIPASRAVPWFAGHVPVTVAALPLTDIVFPSRTDYELLFGRSGFFGRLLDLGHLVKETMAADRLQATAVVVFSVLLALQLVRRRSVFDRRLPDTSSLFTLGFLIAVVPSVTVGLALMRGGVQPHVRHYSVLFLYPLVVGSAVSAAGLGGAVSAAIGDRAGRHRRRVAFVATALMLAPAIAVAARFSAAVATGALARDRSTVPISCIEDAATQFGGRRGIASYWDARPIEVFSERRLDVASVTPLLLHDPTNADLAEFSRTYDFAVTSTTVPQWELPLDAILLRAGQPETLIECGRFTVATWERSGLDLFPTDTIGASLEISGCLLPSQLAEPGADCVLTAPRNPPDGFLSYGPYVGLTAGVYRIEIEVRSSAPASTEVGTWDLLLNGQTDSPVSTGSLEGTNGRWDSHEIDLELDTVGVRTVVEVRVDPSRGPIEVAAVRVKRIG